VVLELPATRAWIPAAQSFKVDLLAEKSYKILTELQFSTGEERCLPVLILGCFAE